ncbi:MAG: hypothetical protein ACJ76Y_18270 [Thermoanaerobaculia bacterium]
MADEDKRKHLDLLQGVISRMASNSFLLKGWSVTLASALFGLSAKDAEPKLALLALLPILVFWGLDAYYLGYERQFRVLYTKAIDLSNPATDFTMTPEPLGLPGWLKVLVRPTVVGLHLPLVLAALGVYALLC